MELIDLVQREPNPVPWAEGDNIPWHEPAFSARMLQEHLSQAHDAASRRTEKIERHVEWIHRQVLSERPAKILDLGCGPGLYSSHLARLGHVCVGIDYSPASIAYARDCAQRERLNCTYIEQDLRQAEYGEGFGLAMLIFGELNIFRPADARNILRKAHHALAVGGQLLLEPHPFHAIEKIGGKGRAWKSANRGLFSDQPFLLLQEHLWDAATLTTTVRYFVVDAASGHITRYAQTFQAYSNADYEALLDACGFEQAQFFPGLGGIQDTSADDYLMAILARKRTG